MTISLAQRIKQEAFYLGFDLCRIVSLDVKSDMPVRAPHTDFFERWIDQGRAGEMTYLARNQEKRRHPALLVDSAEYSEFSTMIVLAVNHYQFELPTEYKNDPSRGIIASYAWGNDYHEIIRPLLYELDHFIRQISGRTTNGKCLVDTGPVLERDWAQVAGIGFTGKNCCTIHPQLGSWLLLATILIPEKVEPDPPVETTNHRMVTPDDVLAGLPSKTNYVTSQIPNSQADNLATQTGTCGSCTRCIDQCPADAFVGPYHLDPLRCISYWTIEAKGVIPRELRSAFGNRIFGCDICQEVCPWNTKLAHMKLGPRTILDGLQAQADRVAIPLLEGFAKETPYWIEQLAFSQRFRRSPIKRAKRHGMLRNVCVALGNWADVSAIDSLTIALRDTQPIVRGHAAWALGQVLRKHQYYAVKTILENQLLVENDEWVREEIAIALGTQK
ncbi:MAG: QueG-associated DUF1730 domain-containing protein [Chloroflexota bacterium]